MMVRFDPFKGFESAARKMSSIMDDIDKGVRVEYGSFSPKVDIMEDDKKILIQAELPGVRKESLKVTVNEGNVLFIKGEKEKKEIEGIDNCCYLKVERNYGSFSRSFLLPDNIKEDSFTAKLDNGVLNISLEKREPVKPSEKTVEIK